MSSTGVESSPRSFTAYTLRIYRLFGISFLIVKLSMLLLLGIVFTGELVELISTDIPAKDVAIPGYRDMIVCGSDEHDFHCMYAVI